MTDDSAPLPADDVGPAESGPPDRGLPAEGLAHAESPVESAGAPSVSVPAPAWRQRPADPAHPIRRPGEGDLRRDPEAGHEERPPTWGDPAAIRRSQPIGPTRGPMPRWPRRRRPTSADRSEGPTLDQQRTAGPDSLGDPDEHTRVNHTTPPRQAGEADLAGTAGDMLGTPPTGIAGLEPRPLVVVGHATPRRPAGDTQVDDDSATDQPRRSQAGDQPSRAFRWPLIGRRATRSPLAVAGRPAEHSVTRTRLVDAPLASSPPTQVLPHVRRPSWGRRWLAGLGAIIAVVALVVVTVSLWPPGTDEATTARLPANPVEPTAVAPERLAVGHCLDSIPTTTSVMTVTVVPCSHPHRGEVIASYRFTERTYPGETVIAATLDEYCRAAVMEAARKADLASLGMWYLAPDRDDWTRHHQPGHCVAISPTSVTGSLMQRITPTNQSMS